MCLYITIKYFLHCCCLSFCSLCLFLFYFSPNLVFSPYEGCIYLFSSPTVSTTFPHFPQHFFCHFPDQANLGCNGWVFQACHWSAYTYSIFLFWNIVFQKPHSCLKIPLPGFLFCLYSFILKITTLKGHFVRTWEYSD